MTVPAVLRAAQEVQHFCERNGWRFCFIGGLAVQRWGEVRLTVDVDLTLLTGFGSEESYIDMLLSVFRGRRDDAREFALRNRVLLLRTTDGIDADIALGASPFEERSVSRASDWPWAEGMRLTTCSADDLIVHKAFAGRDRDWADVEGILTRQHGKLDLRLIGDELPLLLELKGQPEAFDRLLAMVATVDRRLAPE